MGIDAIDAIDTIEEGIEGDFLNRGSVSCQNNRPSEAHHSRFRYLQAALQASPRLHGEIHDTPSPMAGLRLACEAGGSEGGGAGFGLFGEEVVGEGGDVGYIDGAVGVDVGDCFAVGF